jgi:hypothetical protein
VLKVDEVAGLELPKKEVDVVSILIEVVYL